MVVPPDTTARPVKHSLPVGHMPNSHRPPPTGFPPPCTKHGATIEHGGREDVANSLAETEDGPSSYRDTGIVPFVS